MTGTCFHRCGVVATRVVAFSIACLAALSSAKAATGQLNVLTYNVAGLPDGFMTAHPSQNLATIGRLLAPYGLALVQEDYAYATTLRQLLPLPYQSPAFIRGNRLDFGDGLSQFAKLPFSDLRREAWVSCHGVFDSYFDCLTPKGFTASELSLAPKIVVHVYNVHFDAGGSAADAKARQAQVDQLIAAIAERSAGAAILLAGDTNMSSRERPLLARLERETGLIDVCDALHCPDSGRIDRVFYRSSAALSWLPLKLKIDRRFVDARGRALSDHLAVAAELQWTSS